MARNGSRFEKGSGCYPCLVCKKLTRSTGRGDNENVNLCAACYDAAGIENEHYDGHHQYEPCAQCPLCTE